MGQPKKITKMGRSWRVFSR